MWFLESPVPTVALGIFLLAMLGIFFSQTGSRKTLNAMVAVVTCMIGTVYVERVVVTEREEVEIMLQTLAADLEENDVNAVLQHISLASSELRDEAVRTLKRVVVNRAIVKPNLDVEIDKLNAVARFNGVIVASARTGFMNRQPYPRFFILKLCKEKGCWRVVAYEHHPPHRQSPHAGSSESGIP